MATEETSAQVSSEIQTKKAPWVIATALLVSTVLFALIGNPSFAAWLSGTGS